MDTANQAPTDPGEPSPSRQRSQRRAAVILAVIFLILAAFGAVMALTPVAPGCFEWCTLNADYGRFTLAFAIGGLALAAGTWRGNLFCMGVALFLFALGALIAGVFVVFVMLKGGDLRLLLVPAVAAIGFGIPAAAVGLALLARINEP